MIQLDKNTAQVILNYGWHAERDGFRSDYDIEEEIDMNTLEDCKKWIKWAEDEADGGTDHIFYSLLKLQEAIFESKIQQEYVEERNADSQINLQKDENNHGT